jgi:hypothetical protein
MVWNIIGGGDNSNKKNIHTTKDDDKINDCS